MINWVVVSKLNINIYLGAHHNGFRIIIDQWLGLINNRILLWINIARLVHD